MKQWLPFSFFIALLSGCNTTTPTYSPENLEKEQSAYLKADSEHDHGIFVAADERLYIHNINGEKAGDFFKGYPEDAYISPGITEVKVDYYQGQVSSEGCVKFTAEAGKNYIIRKKREVRKVRYWVELEGGKEIINLPCKL